MGQASTLRLLFILICIKGTFSGLLQIKDILGEGLWDTQELHGITLSMALRQRKDVNDRNLEFSWQAYYDIYYIHEYLCNMNRKYPHWTQQVVGGRSFEGRDILWIRINTPKNKGHKHVIFIEARVNKHVPSEFFKFYWYPCRRMDCTCAVTTYFINQLLTSADPEIQTLRENFDWHIFPSVNPEGLQSDLYNSSIDPCDSRFVGTSPLSEIETRTLSQYIAGLKNLTVYLAFHSDAQMMFVPYADSTKHSENYDDLIKIGEMSIEYGFKVNGIKYHGIGTAAELLYSAAGDSMDWVRLNLNVPLVFCYELRGPEPFPAYRIPEQGDEVTQMILGLTVEAQKMGYLY